MWSMVLATHSKNTLRLFVTVITLSTLNARASVFDYISINSYFNIMIFFSKALQAVEMQLAHSSSKKTYCKLLKYQGSQVSRIERDSHSFRSLVTHSRHTSYFSRWKKTLGYLMCRSAQTWPGRAALTMEESNTSPRIPWGSAVRCHLSANQNKKWATQ